MRLLSPWWLAALPVVLGIAWIVARYGRRAVPHRQHLVAVGLRMIGLALLVLALAQPLWIRDSSEKTVLFLLDRSASIDGQARVVQEQFVADALDQAAPEDVVGVAVFGTDLRVDVALAPLRVPQPVRTTVDSSGTDLAGALRASAAVLPTEGSRRIVVLTDAVETSGDARIAARELAEAGIAVDVIALDTGRSADALVTRVDAPVTARQGEDLVVDVTVAATASGDATLLVEAGDDVIPLPVTLQAGTNRVQVTIPGVDTGILRVSASIDAPFDQVPENDTGEALVRVLGPARVGVVEALLGEGADLVRALNAGGIDAELLDGIPGPDELLLYDAMVLVNVPTPGEAVTADIAAYVEDLGRGLLVVGGDQAYGLGGYQGSELEDLLPVNSDPDDLIRRTPIAEVLVIDTSGSMADCHCGGGLTGEAREGIGVNKTDISRAGAGLAISALQETDRVGILAFTSGTRWALDLQTKPAANVVASAINSLVPDGDTEITPALQEALAALQEAPEEIKHMVLFTDGWGDDARSLDVAQEIADAGITLSVLGTGEGTGETLRRMAALGGGQYYPGRDLDAVPEIFVEETLRVARPLIAEGDFFPSLGAASQVTAGLTAAPPLQGYVLTRPKDTAVIALEIGPGDPLLATWQRGLGRASAWTSDATARWSADWVTWDGFVDFWGRVVSDVLPPGLDNPPEVRLDGGAIEVRFDADAPLDASGVATVRDSDGNVSAIPLQRTGGTTFEGRVPVSTSGAYWVAVTVETPDGLVAQGSNGLVAGYADEFAFREADTQLPTDLADITEGRVGPTAAEVFDPAPRRGAAERPLWPVLVAIALALFLLDVGLRRLVVARGDWRVWREAVVPARSERPKALTAKAPPPDEPEEPAGSSREVHPEEETLGRLLRRKRDR
ncbi:MAG: VWA domain-containing protein [Acidimicrobiia bacterium]|nr:VWA domain-containing protein [Acidimicrobiia bacterium]